MAGGAAELGQNQTPRLGAAVFLLLSQSLPARRGAFHPTRLISSNTLSHLGDFLQHLFMEQLLCAQALGIEPVNKADTDPALRELAVW